MLNLEENFLKHVYNKRAFLMVSTLLTISKDFTLIALSLH